MSASATACGASRPGLLHRYLPILGWLPAYDRSWLKGDAVAGLVGGLVAICRGQPGHDEGGGEADVNQPRIHTAVNMLALAIKKAGTTDADKVAAALEGMEWTTLGGDQVVMRREDHQLQMPIYISVHTNKNITYDLDNSGFGLLLESKIDRAKVTLPTTCKMQRPN